MRWLARFVLALGGFLLLVYPPFPLLMLVGMVALYVAVTLERQPGWNFETPKSKPELDSDDRQELWRLASGQRSLASGQRSRDDFIGAVVVEFMHRTEGPWLDRSDTWLADDARWLESELEHVLGTQDSGVECPACLTWMGDGRDVYVVGCPDCAARHKLMEDGMQTERVWR